MAETWYFNMEGDTVNLRSRVEGDGLVGDAFSRCEPGGKILNLSYDELVGKRAGKITIVDNVARIEPMMVPVDHNPFAGD